jgi:hypothetical protein
MTQKEFLLEHNKLSPINLQTTIALLNRFKLEKTSLFKDENWPIEKIRRPFVFWLTSMTSADKEAIRSEREHRCK